MTQAGDPAIQHYFRLDGTLYRSAAAIDDGGTWYSDIERSGSGIWEEVPGSRVNHIDEKKSLLRAKKLVNVLEHTPLIYLAYWEPEVEDSDSVPLATLVETEQKAKYSIRISVGDSYYLYNPGDFVIQKEGSKYVLRRWNGFDAVPVGPGMASLEAACLAVVVQARKEMIEKDISDGTATEELPNSRG